MKAKGGYLGYRPTETCQKVLSNFQELINSKRDVSWQEVCQVRRTEGSCLPIEASFARLPRTTTRSAGSAVFGGSSTASTPQQRVATDNIARNSVESSSGFEIRDNVVQSLFRQNCAEDSCPALVQKN